MPQKKPTQKSNSEANEESKINLTTTNIYRNSPLYIANSILEKLKFPRLKSNKYYQNPSQKSQGKMQ